METISTYEQQANDFLTKTGATITKDFLKFDYHFDSDKDKRNIFKITINKGGKNMVFNFGSSLSDSCKVSNRLISNKKEAVIVYAGVSNTRTGVGMSVNILTNTNTLKDIHEGKQDAKSIINLEHLQKAVDNGLNDAKEYNKDPKNRYNKIENLYFLKVENLQEIVLRAINRKINDLIKSEVLEEQKTPIIYPTNYCILACLTKYDPNTFEDFCSDYGYDEDSIKALKTYEAVKKEFNDLCALFNNEELSELAEIQ